jgi:type II secretory pathway pseudopilin PulG
MRMYVILVVAVVAVLLVAIVLVFADRATEVVRRARKRRALAERLAAAAARAEDKNRARTAAAEASDALTTVLPAILVEDHEPRHVALASGCYGSSGVSQSTDSGGSTIDADAGRPCHGFGIAWTAPRLPMPLPP